MTDFLISARSVLTDAEVLEQLTGILEEDEGLPNEGGSNETACQQVIITDCGRTLAKLCSNENSGPSEESFSTEVIQGSSRVKNVDEPKDTSKRKRKRQRMSHNDNGKRLHRCVCMKNSILNLIGNYKQTREKDAKIQSGGHSNQSFKGGSREACNCDS